jgi:hypothetical protein
MANRGEAKEIKATNRVTRTATLHPRSAAGKLVPGKTKPQRKIKFQLQIALPA